MINQLGLLFRYYLLSFIAFIYQQMSRQCPMKQTQKPVLAGLIR